MLTIIMCGGKYNQYEIPRHLIKVGEEMVVERTIRLLRETGVNEIAISATDPVFEQFGLPILKHENSYDADGYNRFRGYWCDAFYPTDEPVLYIFGDVFFSPEAIKKIVETPTDDIEFFASSPPFPRQFKKQSAEPFALKVQNQEHLHEAIKRVKQLYSEGAFKRKPIMWELWQVIKHTPLNIINYKNYVTINDYTCDVDIPADAKYYERFL